MIDCPFCGKSLKKRYDCSCGACSNYDGSSYFVQGMGEDFEISVEIRKVTTQPPQPKETP